VPSEQWCCWMGGRRIISESAENRGNSCHRSDGSSMTNVRARTPAEVLARGRAASPGRRSSNANSLCGQNSAGSGQSERPFKGIFCDDVSEFESDHLSQPVRLKRITYEGRAKIPRYREVSQIGAGLRVTCPVASTRAQCGDGSMEAAKYILERIAPSRRGRLVEIEGFEVRTPAPRRRRCGPSV
jgi:hypothetical protein